MVDRLRAMKLRFSGGLALLLLAAGCAHHKAASEPAPSAVVQKGYPYGKPLISLGAKFGALPHPVQDTIRAEAGLAEITEVSKSSTPDGVYYKISFRDAQNFPPLYVAADGSVLNPDLTLAIPAPQDASGSLSAGPAVSVRVKDLPERVLSTIHERAPGAEIASVKKEVWGEHVVYQVTFNDPESHPAISVAAEGAVLHHASP